VATQCCGAGAAIGAASFLVEPEPKRDAAPNLMFDMTKTFFRQDLKMFCNLSSSKLPKFKLYIQQLIIYKIFLIFA
jgi:hypothetical protein